MKLKLLLINLLFLAICTSAQNDKGKFFIETGVKAIGGGEWVNFIGKTGFSFNKFKWETFHKDDGSIWQEDTYNSFSWALAPRVGYSLGNYVNAGIDFQYYKNNNSDKDNYRNFTSGLFCRFYFNNNKIKPFVELSSGLGLSKGVENRISPGGAEYQTIEKLKLFYYSGSAGLTFVLSGNVNLSLSAKLQSTIENEVNNDSEWSISYIGERRYYLEINPMLSVSYIFKGKSKNQE